MSSDDLITPNLILSSRDVEFYIQNIEYPIAKNDLLYWVRMNKAPENIVALINQMPEGVYHDFDELDFYIRKAIQSMP